MNTRRAIFPRIRLSLLLLLWFLLAIGQVVAQDVTYLALQRPGQGSVAIDKVKAMAYVTDLGKAGDGDQALLEGLPILDRLAQLNVRNIVFTCSHPHSDHMGGIRAIFQRPASFFRDTDMKNPRFDSITVIDDQISDSLFHILNQSLVGKPAIHIRHISAKEVNAFAGISQSGDEIFIENIPYESPQGTNPHGRSVVTHMILGGKHSTVDFDDASSQVVGKTVQRLQSMGVSSIDSFVVPHHGSAYHDIEPILALKPKVAIVTVNARNPYGHPAPEILLKLMNSIGPANVLFTGSVDRVTLNPDGVQHATYTAADMESYDLFIKPGHERAKARYDLKQIALYQQVYTRMQAASALLKADGKVSGPNKEQLARDEIETRLELAEQNTDNILAFADKLALSANVMPEGKRKLDEITEMQRRALENLDAVLKTYESQNQAEFSEARNRLTLLFTKTPTYSGPKPAQSTISAVSAETSPTDLPERVNQALDDLVPVVPTPVLSNRNVGEVRFVADLPTVRSATPIVKDWKSQIAEEVPPVLSIPFSRVLDPATTEERPGGISMGNAAQADSSLDLHGYLLTYDSSRKSIFLKGPEGAEILYSPPIEPTVLKSIYRYAASGRNAAVSMSFSTSGTLDRVIRLDPAFVDTAVGRDLIATDLIGWDWDETRLPDGRRNPLASEFSTQESFVFRCIGADITPFSDLIDKPTKISRVDTALELTGGMDFQYMADLPSVTQCSITKCKLGARGKKPCHFTNLEEFTIQNYAQMLELFPSLGRVDRYARLVAFLRWARHPGNLAGIDFSVLAIVPASSSRNRTPDAINKN